MSSTIRELRRVRQRRRLGELEWFEVAYRAYFIAFVGATAAVLLAGLIDDVAPDTGQLADVARLGGRVLGVIPIAAVALGLRSGADGGPIALEAADVHHLLLAPVPRRAVLTRPVVQRIRTAAFGAAVAGAVAGMLAADRLPGSRSAWALSGAALGAATGATFVAVAVIAHALGVGRPLATALGLILLGVQVAAAVDAIPFGPGDTLGSLGMWGWRQHPIDLVGVAAVGVLVGMAIALADRLGAAPLVRRAGLVAQLRFAATMQDLRTVMLLRRQLRGEHARARPWIQVPARRRGAGWAVWQRDWRSLARYPVARLGRMAGLALLAGGAATITAAGTTPAVVGVAVLWHLFGLDILEPMSQEIDHPDRTDGFPRPRGWMLVRHLGASAAATVPFALGGAAVVAVAHPDHALVAITLAVPVALGGAAGAVVSIVRDAPDPLGGSITNNAALPPELTGFATTARLALPFVVSVLGTLPMLAGVASPTLSVAARAGVASGLLVAAVVWWVRRRDEWSRKLNGFLEAGRAARAAAS
ncbi:MAG: hypothetical protein ACK5OX_03770 [Desertimonas sp.]